VGSSPANVHFVPSAGARGTTSSHKNLSSGKEGM
jgi:hypothetical protein